MTETEKMLQGRIYDSSVPELAEMRVKAHRLCRIYNSLDEEDPKLMEIRKDLRPNVDSTTFVLAPVQFDYGVNFHMGKRGFINFGIKVLDTCPVTLGDDVFVGPNVSFYTPLHPLLSEERKTYQKENGVWTDKEYAAPIEVGDGTWIAGSVSVGPGVKIGKRCVIGMGSVVLHDIPDDCLAAGNPCRVIRKIAPEDSILLKKEIL